jgi:hypothetical protein
MGIKPEKKGRKKKMAESKKETTKNLNIYQKLLLVRDEFAQEEIKKSGKNFQLSSTFFELKDIVPAARPIFMKYRLLPLTTVASGKATMIVVDVDSPDERFVFELDVQTYEGNKAVTPPQAYGAVVTYYRRYLYMIALDIVEADYLDGNLTPPSVDEPTTNTPAPSPVETESVKPLTDNTSNASELQIKQLKELLKKLMESDPSKEEMIANIAVQTNGFTVINKAECESLVEAIAKMLEGGAE